MWRESNIYKIKVKIMFETCMIGQGVSQEGQRSYRSIKVGLSIVLIIIIIIISSSLLFLNSSVNIPNRESCPA
jgi:hypothetical protein